MNLLRQSTTVTVSLGPALDKTTGVDEETGLTPTVYLSKAGAVQAARNSATAISHDARGWYRIELDATDTATLGRLVVLYQDSTTHLPVWETFTVVPAAVYDALVLGTDKLEVDVSQWNGSNVAAPAAAGYPAVTVKSGTGTGEINLSSGVADANLTKMGGVAQSATDLKDFADAGYDPATNKVEGVKLVDTTTTNTDMRGTDNAYTGTPPTVAEIRTEMDTNSTRLDATVSSRSSHSAADVWTATTRTLTSFGTLVADIWDRATSALTTAGSIGKLLVDNINATISSRATPAQVATELATYDGPTNAEMEARTLAAASYATAANQTAIEGKVDTVDTVVDAIKVETDKLGAPAGASHAADNAAIKAQTAAIETDTQDIQGRIPAALVSGKMDSDARAINSNTAAAVRLALSAGVIIPGTVTNAAVAPTTTEFEASDITEATGDHYNDRVILFTSGALLGQATSITDYLLSAGGRGHFTVPAMTEAPANGDTFIIV